MSAVFPPQEVDPVASAALAAEASTRAAADAALAALAESKADAAAWKRPVRAASSTSNHALTAQGSRTVDGVATAAGDRVLLAAQTAGAENGIYVVGADFSLTRSTDANTAAKLDGAVLRVTQGTANADKQFTLTTDLITLGATALTWTDLSVAPTQPVGNRSTRLATTQFVGDEFPYILAPPPTGDADTDTAALLAAIAKTKTYYGPNGGPTHLRPSSTLAYKLAATGTLLIPTAGSLLGAGCGGRSLAGGEVPPLPNRYATRIDASLITNGAAIDLGSAGSGQKVAGFGLYGQAGNNAAASKYGGAVGIKGGYFSLFSKFDELYIWGFSNQLVLPNCYLAHVSPTVHGKMSGVHGLIAYADGDGVDGLICEGYFADAGLAAELVKATHRPGNICIERMSDVKIRQSGVDECFNGAASIGVYNSNNVEIDVNRAYVSTQAGAVGVQIGDGVTPTRRTKIRGTHIRPYHLDQPPLSVGLAIAALAEDTVVQDVTITDLPAANMITDAGKRTTFRNVNGQSKKARAYLDAVLADNPIGYWRLGEFVPGLRAVADEKGVNPGSYAAAPVSIPGALHSDDDPAVMLNGSTQWAQIAHAASLNVGDVFTLECWVNRFGFNGAAGAMFHKNVNAYALQDIGAGSIRLDQSGVAVIVVSTVAVPATGWHHIVATKNGAAVKLYIDGVDVTGTVTNATVLNNTSALTLGGPSGLAYNGGLDECALYGVALSPARVLAHYRAR